ncbi:MAG: GAF domain-containing protein [Proteobacteria bacterium]|jgi:PAS domain S-box-containing protein|nr:GAF domain-containing protein [Desulfocapsa sp.]MBU3944267.1 GAF domain-containing protein [Pseudomonadota bacterium]MCG2745272.1 GAF domain-containing protein [Desulfobacteraceae bacterium]MBU3982107.1 GAF domain-containing protein [Pseudomonadota bacterium]MBU4028225.1 GAF domain-containing protein [Pseudomonadota bacterium]
MEQINELKYLKVFQKVTKLISMVLDHQQVMDTIVRELPGLLDIDAATIRLLDSSTNSFVMGAAHGLSMEYLSRTNIDTAETMAMINSGYPVAKTDVDQNTDFSDQELISQEGIKSVLTLPILFQDSVIGILRLLTRRNRTFTSEEISFSMALAEQVGIAISNSRMFTEMENQIDFMKEVQEISTLVNSTLDLDSVLNTIVERLPRSMACKACTIRLLQPQTNQLELAASHGISEEYRQRGEIEREKNIALALTGEPVSIYDVSRDERVMYKDNMEKEDIKSLLAVPLKVKGEVIGIIRILSESHHCFTNSEINFAVTIAEIGGTAIKNARTYRQITLLFNQVEESERFVANILNCIRPQLLVVDKDRHLVLANRVFLTAMNKEENEILGADYHSLWLGHDCPVEHCPVEQVLTTGQTASHEHQMIQDDGMHWIERTASPMLNEGGEVEFVIEVIRDITAKRQLEQEHLERVKLQGVVELAGTVAHEINSPLFAALGTAQLLEEELESKELADDIQTIIRNLKNIGELTKKMTTMTGFESRDYVGDTKIVELR